METPELDKIREVREQSEKIGDFLEWLRGEKIVLTEWDDEQERYFDIHKNIEEILAEYFKINLNKAEEERQAILRELREE